MNEARKYIVINNGFELAIVFDPLLNHNDVGSSLNVVSAGFCHLPDKLNADVAAYGESFTLKIKSRPQDAEIIEKMLRN